MELFLFRHPEYERLYNCSGFNISQVPLEQRRFVPEAVGTVLLCALYYVLYLPCMLSIWGHMRDDHGIPNACFRLLFYIGVMDLTILWIIGFLHGWLSLQGAVYCSNPTLIYLAGVAATTIWAAESTADLILAINRCVDILSPRTAEKLFADFRTLIWLLLCSMYALYWLLFERPALFNGVFFAWFFNPFEGYRPDEQGLFLNRMEAFHDTMVAISSPIIYLLFFIVFWFKTQSMKKLISGGHNGSTALNQPMIILSRAQKMTFLQVLIISLINTLTGSLYVIMQRINTPQWLITVAQFAWLHIHGFPPVVYLTLNKTIRTDCRILLCKILRIKGNHAGRAHRVGALKETQEQKGSRSTQQQKIFHFSTSQAS